MAKTILVIDDSASLRQVVKMALTGAGSNVLGCQIGFSELLRAGQIERMPRIFAAQPANCGPIAAAFLAARAWSTAAGEVTLSAAPPGRGR